MIKYFHELTEQEYEKIVKRRKDAKRFVRDYPQPEWCLYPEAVSPLGCWSLIGFMVTGEEYCRKCDCHKNAIEQVMKEQYVGKREGEGVGTVSASRLAKP